MAAAGSAVDPLFDIVSGMKVAAVGLQALERRALPEEAGLGGMAATNHSFRIGLGLHLRWRRRQSSRIGETIPTRLFRACYHPDTDLLCACYPPVLPHLPQPMFAPQAVGGIGFSGFRVAKSACFRMTYQAVTGGARSARRSFRRATAQPANRLKPPRAEADQVIDASTWSALALKFTTKDAKDTKVACESRAQSSTSDL